jgi:Na+/H+-translocating membrane pyrophosphatase
VFKEVKKQFRDIPYLNQINTVRPDIIKATDNNILNTMNAIIIPALLMVITPIIFYYFNLTLLIGFVLGVFLSSSLMSFSWSNIGESLKQIKQYILKGNYGGKNTQTYENILIADNFGDVFKDLLSPSINIFVKTIPIIALLLINLK